MIVGQSIRITLSRIALAGWIFGLRPADQVIREERRVLGTRDLGRMKTAVDMDERLSLVGELARRRVGQPGRMRQPLRDLPVTLDLLEVFGTRDEREVPRAA